MVLTANMDLIALQSCLSYLHAARRSRVAYLYPLHACHKHMFVAWGLHHDVDHRHHFVLHTESQTACMHLSFECRERTANNVSITDRVVQQYFS